MGERVGERGSEQTKQVIFGVLFYGCCTYVGGGGGGGE